MLKQAGWASQPCPLSVLSTHRPVSTSHILKIPLLPDSAQRLSLLRLTECTGANCASNVRMQRPVVISHSLSFASSPPDKIRLALLFRYTDSTVPICPSNVRI